MFNTIINAFFIFEDTYLPNSKTRVSFLILFPDIPDILPHNDVDDDNADDES